MALLLATAGVACVGLLAAESAAEERRRRRIQYALASADPALRAQLAGQAARMLAVHVESAQLAPKLANKGLRVAVKLGEPHRSVRQFTPREHSGPDGQVNFGSTCVFPWAPYQLQPVLRIRLMKAGLVDVVAAKHDFWLPDLSAVGTVEQEVLFFDDKRECLGQLRLVIQLHTMPHLHAVYGDGMMFAVPAPTFAGRRDGYQQHDYQQGGYQQGGYQPGAPTTPQVVAGHVVRPGEHVVLGRPVPPEERSTAGPVVAAQALQSSTAPSAVKEA